MTRHRKAKEAVCNWLVHEKLNEDGFAFHPKDGGSPWTKCIRPTSSQYYYFIQHLHEVHNPALGTPYEAELVFKDVKDINTKGSAGKTKLLRERVRPIAAKYIASDMPDVYEVQAARRAAAARVSATSIQRREHGERWCI